MIHLYDFDKNKIKGIKNLIDFKIESELSTGDKKLSFSYSKKLGKDIKEEFYIRTKTDEFVIKSVAINGEYIDVIANLNVEELEGSVREEYKNNNSSIEESLNLALKGSSGGEDNVWKVGICNINKKRILELSNVSVWQIIQKAIEVYRVEIQFDTINKEINIYEKLGEDKGAYFIDSLNLIDISKQSDTYDFYTRIIPIGSDGLKIGVKGEDYVENYEYSKKIKTLIWKNGSCSDEKSLAEDAKLKLEDISKPYESYRVNVIDIASMNREYDILSYSLGDIVTLVSKESGIKSKQRIIKIVEYPNEPQRNTCELANAVLKFEDIQKNVESAVDTVSNITFNNGTIDGKKVKDILTSNIKDLSIEKLNVGELESTKITVGNIQANVANITSIEAINATIDKLDTKFITTGRIEATEGEIGNLKSETAEIKNLVNGNLTSNNIHSLNLTTEKVTVDKGFIKDAMIDTVDAGKINAGKINTNNVQIESKNGGIIIADSTQQFKDANGIVRIQMGQDTTGEFTFGIFDENGTGTLIDHTGVKESALGEGIIKEHMIGNGEIGGKKIDINSLITEVNDDTNTSTIKGTKVMLDTKGQSLEVAFNSMSSTVNTINEQKMYKVDVSSTNGNIFKNGNIDTTLSARLYSWDTDITNTTSDSRFIWTRVSDDTAGDTSWNIAHSAGAKTIRVTSSDVTARATFKVSVLDVEGSVLAE